MTTEELKTSIEKFETQLKNASLPASLQVKIKAKLADAKAELKKLEGNVKEDVKKVEKKTKAVAKKVEKKVEKVETVAKADVEKIKADIAKFKKELENKSLPASLAKKIKDKLAQAEKDLKAALGTKASAKKDDDSYIDKKGFLKVIGEKKSKEHSKGGGYYISETYVPYDDKYSTRVYFVSGDNGDEFGQYPTLEKAKTRLTAVKKDKPTTKKSTKKKVAPKKSTKKKAAPKKEKADEVIVEGKTLTVEDCEELIKKFKSDRNKSRRSSKKSRSRSTSTRVAANIAQGIETAIDSIPAAEIAESPRAAISKMERLKKAGQEFLESFKAVLGDEYSQIDIKKAMKEVQELIDGLEKKYLSNN